MSHGRGHSTSRRGSGRPSSPLYAACFLTSLLAADSALEHFVHHMDALDFLQRELRTSTTVAKVDPFAGAIRSVLDLGPSRAAHVPFAVVPSASQSALGAPLEGGGEEPASEDEAVVVHVVLSARG